MEERRRTMPSKTREARLDQKSYLETKLKERLETLGEKGLDPRRAAKDRGVRKLRADLRSTVERLATIEEKEKKIAEMAGRKAEQQAAPKFKDKGKKKQAGEDEPEMSKRQRKKLEKQQEKQKKKTEESES
jgi:transposase